MFKTICEVIIRVLFYLTIALVFFTISNRLFVIEHLCLNTALTVTDIEYYLRTNNSKPYPLFKKKNRQQYVSMRLKITAYNSEVNQCDDDPFIGAWNNKVRDGMIAVSRDLEKYGLTNGTPIIINGKEFIILDRMHKRKRKQLDIWMKNKEEAENWGIKYCEVKIPIEYVNLRELFIDDSLKVVL